MRWVGSLLAAVCLLPGCDILSPEEEPFTACHIRGISGTWQISYVELDGTCGTIPDEIVSLVGDQGPSGNCVVYNSLESPDMCRLDVDFECESGPSSSVRWTGVLEHLDYDLVQGTMSGQVSSGGQAQCRSTYRSTWVKL